MLGEAQRGLQQALKEGGLVFVKIFCKKNYLSIIFIEFCTDSDYLFLGISPNIFNILENAETSLNFQNF